jgi:arylsulfatase A-like enzyme
MSKKSVILFCTDDHAAWAMRCAGWQDVCTPALDRLASEGTRFTEAFTPSPVCSPARACLMTGRMPSAVGIHDWLDESNPDVASRDWLAGIPTLPERFHQHGYHTGLSGKWHLGSPGQIPGGFDFTFGMSPSMRTHMGTDTYFLNGKAMELTGNRSEHIADHALSFLDQRPDDQPFFLMVNHFATHSPYVASAHDPDTVSPFQNQRFPDMPRLPAHPEAHSENGPRSTADPEQERLSRWKGYAAGVSEIDHSLKRIRAYLEDQNLLDNTLIIYTSDHGCCQGHHGVWGKGNGTRPVNFYDTSLRIPLILRGPGIPSGETNPRSVTHLDTHATVLEAAGIPLPDVDGQPGASLFHPDTSDQTVYAEYGDARMIRTPQWKYIAYAEDHSERLFDLTRDPDETRNLANDPALKSIRENLQAKLQHAFRQFSDPAHDGLRILDFPLYNPYEPWNNRRKQPQESLPC